jgi:catechol 2,3-dioxygenase-like lactoylglutathione lyase family enzyme
MRHDELIAIVRSMDDAAGTRHNGERPKPLREARRVGDGRRADPILAGEEHISLPSSSSATLEDMTIQRMDNVGIVVDDLKAAIAFFVELGLELEGETTVEGRWVDRTVGLDGVRSDIAMLRTPDGHGRLELSKFHTPPATTAEPNAPVNTLGIRRIMFAVDDIDAVLGRLQAHGAELVGEVVQYEDSYRLCYVRGPEGILVSLAEQLS